MTAENVWPAWVILPPANAGRCCRSRGVGARGGKKCERMEDRALAGSAPVDRSDLERGREHSMRARIGLIAFAALIGLVAAPAAAQGAGVPFGATCIVHGK